MTPASCRALALFFGSFALLNQTLGLWVSGFDANLWWLDLRVLPARMRFPVTVWLALALLASALDWRGGRIYRLWVSARGTTSFNSEMPVLLCPV